MQMLYNSDSYVVVQFELPAASAVPVDAHHAGSPDDAAGPGRAEAASAVLTRGGFEIVDKRARREVYIEGALADSFEQGVQALARENPSEEDFDEFIGRYCAMAPHPVVLH